MKNKNLKRAVALGTLSTVSLTTAINPIASAYAEQAPAEEDNDGIVDSSTSDTEVDTSSNEVIATPLNASRDYTISDIGLSASLTDGVSIDSSTLSYTCGTKRGINIAATVLDGSVNIQEVRLRYEGAGIEDTLKNKSASSSLGGVIEFSPRDNISVSDLTLCIVLSNGQVINTDLYSLIPSLKGVNTIKVNKISGKDLSLATSLVGKTTVKGNTLYYKGNTAGIKLDVTSTQPNTSVSSVSLDVYSNSTVSNIATDSNSVIKLSSLSGLNLSKCKLKAVVTDAQGVNNNVEAEGTRSIANMLGLSKELSSIVEDTTAPTITFTNTTAGLKVYDGEKYVIKDGIVNFKATDSESGLGDVSSVKVKGTNTDVIYSYNKADGTIAINTNQFGNGKHSISIKIEDGVGNSGTLDYTINVQKSAPSIQGYSHSNVVSENNTSYAKNSLDIYIGADTDKLLESIKLYKDGSLYDESTSKSTKFTISDSGSYKIVVTDSLGNSKTYKLSELFNDLSDTIVVDSVEPTCNISITNSTEVGDWYTGGDTKINISLSDNIRLKKAKVTINGTTLDYDFNDTTKVIEIPLSSIGVSSNGVYSITVKTTDIAGNTNTTKPYKLNYNNSKPNVDLSVSADYVESGNKAYVNGDIAIGTRNNCSDVSGIDSIELIKDGKVISDTLPFVISDSGSYQVKVTNSVGLSTTVPLSSLMGTISNDIIIDSDDPELSRIEGFNPSKVIGEKNWYKGEPTFKIKVKEANLKSFTATVSGCDDYTTEIDGDYLVVKTKGAEGKITLLVTAIDCYGHISTDRYVYYVDDRAPKVINAYLSEEYVERGGKLYFQKTPTVSIETIDVGSGVESYNLTGDKKETNSSGVFTLGEGNYYIEVKDNLGNTTGVKPLSEVLGLPSNTFVVDGDAPTINATRPEGDHDSWYGDDVKYAINLQDNIGIKSATVYINNQVVEDYTLRDDEDTKKLTVYADTSRVQPDENGMYQIKVDVMDKSNNPNSWSDTIYIDKTAPKIDTFIFTGDGFHEGVNLNGTSRYGFFFNGNATCEIHVSDGDISSGLNTLHVTLENQDGTLSEQTVNVSKGYAVVSIPNNFKGFISAYAVDNVGHKGETNQPDGVITEDGNYFINNLNLSINLPDTNSYDIAGVPLYSSDITATAEIGCNFAGIKNIKWGIGDETLGNVDVDADGNPTGDTVNIKQMGKNLVLSLSEQLSLQGNSNGETVWIEVTDRAGHTSSTNRKFSIDKDAPIINVSYDTSNGNGYYNQSRTAIITVDERNFDASKFKISGISGTLGSWSNKDGVWTNTITFSEDGEYQFSLDCTDRVGNVAKTYSSEKFTIDKTNPVLSVNWNLDNPSNGNFYKETRVATVTVVEKNFDPSKFALQGSGSLGGWSSNGDTHTATISFDVDGEYEFSISGEDLAGNKSETYSSGKFIIDKTVPTLEINGVQDGVSYKEDVGVSVKIADSYIDTSATSVTLVGKRNGSLRLNGSLNEQTGEFYFKEFPRDEKYDDIYTLKATVVDKAGNLVEQNLTFSVNRFGSKYEFINASILNTYLNKAQDVEIVESNVDKLDIDKAKVSVILDGNETKVKDSLISISESDGDDGKYNYSYKIDKEAFETDGKYLVQIYSHAEEGTDYNSVSEEYSFVLDTVDPTIIVSGIKSNTDYNEYEKNVTIDVRDMSGVKDIEVTLNGEKVNPDKENGVYSFKVLEKSSTQDLSVKVTDLAGNTSTTEVNNFLVTSNIWVFIFNQLWFKISIGALIAFISAIIALLVRNRRKSRKEEDEILRQNMELYRASSSTSTGGTSGEKDLVQDLEEKSDN